VVAVAQKTGGAALNPFIAQHIVALAAEMEPFPEAPVYRGYDSMQPHLWTDPSFSVLGTAINFPVHNDSAHKSLFSASASAAPALAILAGERAPTKGRLAEFFSFPRFLDMRLAIYDATDFDASTSGARATDRDPLFTLTPRLDVLIEGVPLALALSSKGERVAVAMYHPATRQARIRYADVPAAPLVGPLAGRFGAADLDLSMFSAPMFSVPLLYSAPRVAVASMCFGGAGRLYAIMRGGGARDGVAAAEWRLYAWDTDTGLLVTPLRGFGPSDLAFSANEEDLLHLAFDEASQVTANEEDGALYVTISGFIFPVGIRQDLARAPLVPVVTEGPIPHLVDPSLQVFHTQFVSGLRDELLVFRTSRRGEYGEWHMVPVSVDTASANEVANLAPLLRWAKDKYKMRYKRTDAYYSDSSVGTLAVISTPVNRYVVYVQPDFTDRDTTVVVIYPLWRGVPR
jgi:hypothetical protein